METYRLDVKTTSELRVCHSLKVDNHDDKDDSLPDPSWMVEITGTSGYTKTHGLKLYHHTSIDGERVPI